MPYKRPERKGRSIKRFINANATYLIETLKELKKNSQKEEGIGYELLADTKETLDFMAIAISDYCEENQRKNPYKPDEE